MRVLALVLLCLTGCNVILGLDPTHGGPPEVDASSDATISSPDGATNGHCVIGNAPRDTLCNDLADQCDGNGNCVDCTTSGGCGECCVCSNQVCIPA